MLGIILNNRRLAFVSFPVGLIVMFTMLQGPVKVGIRRSLLWLAPFAFVYVLVGQNSTKTIFKPAVLLMSVTKQDDRSSGTRDIENFNLIWTLKRNKLIGAGWGHEYVELVQADDISAAFKQYLFIAHNSVLWLWTVGGLVGFTVMWMPIVLGIFFARRAYAFARFSIERSTAAMCIVMLTTYMMQAWGDMGVMGLNSTLTAGLAIAMSAKLAVMTGAFPARLNLFSVRAPSMPVQATVTLPHSMPALPKPSVALPPVTT
jgi:O-Antigen ligase